MKFLQSSWAICLLGCVTFLGSTFAFLNPAKLQVHAQEPAEEAHEEHVESGNTGPSWEFVNPEVDQIIAELRAEKAALQGSAQIKAEIESSDSDFDREKLQERLAQLAGQRAEGIVDEIGHPRRQIGHRDPPPGRVERVQPVAIVHEGQELVRLEVGEIGVDDVDIECAAGADLAGVLLRGGEGAVFENENVVKEAAAQRFLILRSEGLPAECSQRLAWLPAQ